MAVGSRRRVSGWGGLLVGGLLALALWVLRLLRSKVLRGPNAGDGRLPARAKRLAGSSLALWTATIVSGRWLAYTSTRLLAYFDLC